MVLQNADQVAEELRAAEADRDLWRARAEAGVKALKHLSLQTVTVRGQEHPAAPDVKVKWWYVLAATVGVDPALLTGGEPEGATPDAERQAVAGTR